MPEQGLHLLRVLFAREQRRCERVAERVEGEALARKPGGASSGRYSRR